MDPGVPLYHLALTDEWADALEQGRDYERSTVGRSLAEEGFIHTSFASQVEGTAAAFYAGREVVLLTIDREAVPSEVRLDVIADGREFPHVYGPIPLAAVASVDEVPMRPDGTHDFAGLLAPEPSDRARPRNHLTDPQRS